MRDLVMLVFLILVAWTSVAVMLAVPVGRLCAIRASSPRPPLRKVS